jgi:hypothetical protein
VRLVGFRLYLAYSFSQAAPWPPGELGHPYVVVSADDVYSHDPGEALAFLSRWRGRLRLLVDSGGYRRISRGRLPEPSLVLEVQEALAGELGASVVPVLLDTPVRDPLHAEPGECAASNRATAARSRLWQRVFGDHYLYPIHACSVETLRRAVEVLRETHPTVAYVGLGSLAPLAARRPRKALEIVWEARRLLGDRRLHVFGAGNGLAAYLSLAGLADSADTASHIIDARFGLARDPHTLSMAVVAPRRARGRPRRAPGEIAGACGCPVCRSQPGLLASWGRRGLIARAVHNAYWLLRAVSEPGLASRLAGLRGLVGEASRSGARGAPGPR